jgi:hypothetical protein
MIDTISVATPVLNNPTAITSTHLFKSPGSFSYSNRTSAISLPYAAKSGADIDSITITDHKLDGCAGLIRLQNGHVGKLNISRVSLLNGTYKSGVAAGLVLIGGADVDEISISDCDYYRSQPITSPSDIYAAILTGGGHNDTTIFGSCQKLTMQRVRARNFFTNYSTDAYKNSDAAVGERTFANALFDQCDFQNGADAGIDWKGPNWRIQDTILGGCRENIKAWSSANHGYVKSLPPSNMHIQIMSMPGTGRTGQTFECHEVFCDDPKKPIVVFNHGPGVYRATQFIVHGAQKGQILAKADSDSLGSEVWINGVLRKIDKTTVLL